MECLFKYHSNHVLSYFKNVPSGLSGIIISFLAAVYYFGEDLAQQNEEITSLPIFNKVSNVLIWVIQIINLLSVHLTKLTTLLRNRQGVV